MLGSSTCLEQGHTGTPAHGAPLGPLTTPGPSSRSLFAFRAGPVGATTVRREGETSQSGYQTPTGKTRNRRRASGDSHGCSGSLYGAGNKRRGHGERGRQRTAQPPSGFAQGALQNQAAASSSTKAVGLLDQAPTRKEHLEDQKRGASCLCSCMLARCSKLLKKPRSN